MSKRYLILLAAVIGFILSSCFKVEPTIATITVLNEANVPVPGAEVWLYNYGDGGSQQNSPRFDTIQFTNGSGKTSFDFSDFYEAGQSGFVVLNVRADKNGQIGQTIINIEEQKTTEESVVIE